MSAPSLRNTNETISAIPIWRKGEAQELTNPSDLRPGDILILPSSRRENLENLLPIPDDATKDQYEAAHLLSRDRLAIRFTPHLRDQLAAVLDEEPNTAFLETTASCFAIQEDEETWVFDTKTWKSALPAFAKILAENLKDEHPQKALWQHAAWRSKDPKTPRGIEDWKFIPYPEGTHRGVLLQNRSRIGFTPWPLAPEDLGHQGNESEKTVDLTAHSQGVAERAENNAAHLPENLRACLRDAALLHDLGKLDPRFQALLYGCFLHAVAGREPRAKSDRPYNPRAEAALRKALNLPDGFRHELLSALIVAESKAFANHPETDLLLHLIASHHGRCRAMAPVIQDKNPEPFDAPLNGETIRFAGRDYPLAHLSEGVTRRFWELTRRYGWWGLTYLETLLRLADQYESANPAKP